MGGAGVRRDARPYAEGLMQYDIGLTGLAELAAIALLFGVFAQFGGRAESRWLWLVAAAGWFAGGLIASELVVAGGDGAQPIVDGLAFDQALLGGLIAGSIATLIARFVTGSGPFHQHRPTAA